MPIPFSLYLIVYLMGFLLSTPLLLFSIALAGPAARGFGRKLFSLGLTSVYRPVISVNDEDNIVLKRRRYHSGRGIGQVKIGKMYRDVLDPQDRLHHCYGTPLGFFDEVFGVLFDPRDADVAERAREHWDDSTHRFETQADSETGGRDYIRGFYELSRGVRGVVLSPVRNLIGGGADAHAAERVIEHYKTSQDPKNTTTSMRQFLLVVGTFIGTLLFWWFAGSQSGGGGGGGDVRNISFGLLLLLGLGSPRAFFGWVKRVVVSIYTTDGDQSTSGDGGGRNWRAVFRGLVAVLVITGFFAGLAFVFSLYFPRMLVAVLVGVFILGLVTLPGIAALNRGLPLIGVLLGKLYIILGLLPFDRPVIHLNDYLEYEILDASNTEGFDVREIPWYRFALSWVGVTYNNTVENWPGSDVAVQPDSEKWPSAIGRDVVTDGGESLLPSQYRPTSDLSYGGCYGFIPADPSDDSVYVNTHHPLSWFLDVGQDTNLLRAFQYAKEKFANGTKPVSDKYVMGLMIVMMILASGVGWWVFY